MRGVASPMFFALSLISALAAAAAHPESLLGIVPKVPNPESIRDGDGLYCESWKFSAETNNAGNWKTVPARCVEYVKEYMNGPRYAADCSTVTRYSIEYARNVSISLGAKAGKDAWIFDVDETLLSNLPYYRTVAYGSKLFNETSFNEWVDSAAAPAIPSSLKLYKELQRLGFRLILLTGRTEDQRHTTQQNLLAAGFRGWEKLILRGPSDKGKKAELYKSQIRARLESLGYKIHGNSGDQWSDLNGTPLAGRSFKLPNPMYNVA